MSPRYADAVIKRNKAGINVTRMHVAINLRSWNAARSDFTYQIDVAPDMQII